jgi:hypothetical protein
MKRIFAMLVLTCALSVSTFAGEIPTCSPSPTAATSEVPTVGTQPGNIPTGDSSTPPGGTESGVLTDVLLTLVSLILR